MEGRVIRRRRCSLKAYVLSHRIMFVSGCAVSSGVETFRFGTRLSTGIRFLSVVRPPGACKLSLTQTQMAHVPRKLDHSPSFLC